MNESSLREEALARLARDLGVDGAELVPESDAGAAAEGTMAVPVDVMHPDGSSSAHCLVLRAQSAGTFARPGFREEVERAAEVLVLTLQCAWLRSALAAGEERHARLCERTSVFEIVFEVTPEERFKIARVDGAEKRTMDGRPPEGRHVEDVYAPDVAAHLLHHLRLCAVEKRVVEYDERLSLTDPSRFFHTTLVPEVDGNGRVRAIVATASSTVAESESALRESELRFRQIAETVREVFWVVDGSTGEVIYVSPAYEEVWGRTCESVTREPLSWLDAVHEDDRARVEEAIRDRLSLGSYDEIYRIRRPDGTQRWIRARAFQVARQPGSEERVIGLAEDITTLRKTEEQLRHVQKMDALGRFAAAIAHDFNNVLMLVQCCVQSALAGAGPSQREDLDIALDASKKAAELTRNLLAFSRQQGIGSATLAMSTALPRLVRMIERLLGPRIEVVFEPSPEPLSVEMDSGHFDQIVVNLAVNARDAMPKGGRFTIATSANEVDASYARANVEARPGSYVRLAIRDTGTGMTDAVRARVFEPFFTTKSAGEGTGLGLSTVHGIVRQAGGWIELETKLGEGTTFFVYLPRAPDARPATGSGRGSAG